MALRITCVCLLAVAALTPAAAAKPPRVLMTGDSLIDSIAAQAKRKLERKREEARIIHDGRPGEGITRSWRTNWVDHARIQMRRHRPRATVVMLGANDGFPMLDDRGHEVPCCHRAWIEAYAREVARMIKVYTARGRRLYWLTLPAPADDGRRKICLAVNMALRRAVRGFDRARLLDMVEVFTPGFRFRRKMRVDGKRVVVREPDGVHLNATGAAVAIRHVRRAMRADGVIR